MIDALMTGQPPCPLARWLLEIRRSLAHPRWRDRRTCVMLGRDGMYMSPGRAYRLWQQAGLEVPKKRLRRQLALTPMCLSTMRLQAFEAASLRGYYHASRDRGWGDS
jgi:hypothetical protein